MRREVDLEACGAVEAYFEAQLLHQDSIPPKVLEYTLTQPIPKVQITPTQGKFLQLLIQISGSRRVLEIGTLGGYSAVWMALGLPEDGHLLSLDFDPKCIAIAQKSLEIAGPNVAKRVQLQEGRALDILDQLIADQTEPFDFFFIDADKENNPHYLARCLQLSHPGTLIVADNVVRQGKILLADYKGNNIKGLRQFFDDVHGNPRLSATALQMAIPRGWDGMALLRVND